ncbi:MAG: hypothetical protein HY646_06960 [Acidobacteria bacterium]|nr:hypothetical protein [Acidobacteriota bacterium]
MARQVLTVLERERIEAVADARRSSLDPIILDRKDGLISLEGSGGGIDPSGLRDNQGRIWISTIDGIVMIDPATFQINRVLPPTVIEQVTLAGGPAKRRDDG